MVAAVPPMRTLYAMAKVLWVGRLSYRGRCRASRPPPLGDVRVQRRYLLHCCHREVRDLSSVGSAKDETRRGDPDSERLRTLPMAAFHRLCSAEHPVCPVDACWHPGVRPPACAGANVPSSPCVKHGQPVAHCCEPGACPRFLLRKNEAALLPVATGPVSVPAVAWRKKRRLRCRSRRENLADNPLRTAAWQ